MSAPTGNEALTRAVLDYALEHMDTVADDEVLAAQALASCPAEYQQAMAALTARLSDADRAEAMVRLDPMLHALTVATIGGLRAAASEGSEGP